MSSVLGVSAAGIGMGGTVALLQAAAATGAPLAPVLAPVVLPVLAVGAAVGVAGVAGVAVAGVAVANRVNEGRPLPKGRTGEPTRAAGRYVVAAHDFGDVLFWQSDDLEAAKTVFRDLRLRRILFDLDGDGGKPTLVHGVTREWNEMKHEGEAPHVDKEIRHALQAALDKERARKTHVQ